MQADDQLNRLIVSNVIASASAVCENFLKASFYAQPPCGRPSMQTVFCLHHPRASSIVSHQLHMAIALTNRHNTTTEERRRREMGNGNVRLEAPQPGHHRQSHGEAVGQCVGHHPRCRELLFQISLSHVCAWKGAPRARSCFTASRRTIRVAPGKNTDNTACCRNLQPSTIL